VIGANMGILNSYIEENELNKKESNNNETINIVISLTGFEDDMFLGTRMDTKEGVKIKLRPVEQKGDFKRPEASDFADKRSKRFAPIGKSTLLFESCYQEDSGIWNSRWATALSTPKMESRVFILNSNVKINSRPSNEYVEVNTLKERVKVSNLEELKCALLKSFTATTNRARGFAVIKLSEANGDIHVFQAYPKLIDVPNENGNEGETIKVMDSPEESYLNFENDTKRSKIVFDLINNPEIDFEVFIGSRLYLGADTNKKIIENRITKEAFSKEYFIKSEVEGGYDKAGFKKTIIAIRNRDDGSVFVTALKPLVNNKIASPIELLKM
jgi:hypothetical protein